MNYFTGILLVNLFCSTSTYCTYIWNKRLNYQRYHEYSYKIVGISFYLMIVFDYSNV